MVERKSLPVQSFNALIFQPPQGLFSISFYFSCPLTLDFTDTSLKLIHLLLFYF